MMMIVVRYKGRWKWDGFVGLNLWKKLTVETNGEDKNKSREQDEPGIK